MNFHQSYIKYLLATLIILISRISATLSETEIQQQYVQSTKSIIQYQAKYNVPFLLLMSKDQVSVVQCPLIDNGMITVAYSLDGNENIELENETKDAFIVGEREWPSSPSASSATSSGPSIADAREFEQMPQSVITQQTTLGLGKSEWQQQIASNSISNNSIADKSTSVTNNPEEVEKSNSKRNEAAEDATDITIPSSDGNNNERKNIKSPRKRRSNSLTDFFVNEDDYTMGNNAFRSTTNADLNERTFSYSKMQNVTSARFTRATFTTTREKEEEEENKKKNYRISYTGTVLQSSAEDDKNSDVQFSDIDVHMELGYAFVADSTGRIHRFKLSGFEQISTTNSRMFNSFPQENDYSNTIDLTNTKTNQHSNGYSNVASKQNSTTERQKFYHFQAPVNVDIVDGKETVDSSDDNNNNNDDANRVGQNKNTTNSVVTHEQSGRHPTVSGLESLLMHNGKSGSVASTSEQTFNVNQQQQLKMVADSSRPRIIWSRNKNGVSSSIKTLNRQEHQSFNSAPVEQKSLPSSTTGAFPALNTEAKPDNHMVNEAQQHTGNAIRVGEIANASDEDASEEEEQQLADQGNSVDDKQNNLQTDSKNAAIECNGQSLTSQLAGNKKKPGSHMRTEITVDWLNNLLFVLDKYRLVVVDFDGNNELVLIDDFNHNNRPIDIKVDPVNDFLFWLQVGNFHNTIYKLDLNVLSMPTAAEKLLANASKLTQQHGSTNNNINTDSSSELIALISHHYAHPIITNLPQHARLFTIDHKHSRIYVPLAPDNNFNFECNKTNSRDETEVFRSNEDSTNVVTHMNNTLFNRQLTTNSCGELTKSCNDTIEYTKTSSVGQILAYNLDGTDVGPLRSADEKTHLTGLDDMQDFTLDSDKGYLYWLTNNGQELFEEYKSESDSNFHSAQHNLDGKKYSKLIHFGTNQPRNQKARFNLRKLIHILSTTTTANRQVRSDGLDQIEDRLASGRHGHLRPESTSFSRNAPYLILAITCLIVFSFYLIYSFVFQTNRRRNNVTHRDGSMSGSSSISESQVDCEVTTNGFLGASTISRWIVEPEQVDSSTINRNSLNYNDRLDSCDVESTINTNTTGNAITEHYGDELITNWTRWPSQMNDLPNGLYVPKEVLEDKELSSIRRISLNQLEIDQCDALGEGHFGYVLQGSITCTKDEKTCHLHGSNINTVSQGIGVNVATETMCYTVTQLDSLQNHRNNVQSSVGSSGHGSSSTTSEYVAGPSNIEISNGDYLTPKSHCNSSMSDYALENTTSKPDSYSSYYNSSVCQSTLKQSKCLSSNMSQMKVAIKRLKINASDEEKRDFLQEAKLLANFNHPNIVHLIGICLDRGNTLIVMELMLGGDLIRYMQKNRPTSHNFNNLTEDDLLSICLDIVNGCYYLEKLKYIHRDLAARNCLVSSIKKEERVVKLADFGLARDIYKNNYYKKLTDSAMPLKWMAPESLNEQKFTIKSDVWSFGVVMWEVMGYCLEKPYGDVEPCFTRDYLMSGKRLPKPANCCDNMYKLMNDCWQLEPSRRPTFEECRAELIEIRNSKN